MLLDRFITWSCAFVELARLDVGAELTSGGTLTG